MATQHVVVDGSNIATEGRSTPSLAQLEEAIAELRKEMPDAEVTVVVDATFAHRIDPDELPRFEEAALRGEYVSPPAGAIGRGDAFLLRIAEKVDGIVLSNDSFQEFHGEHAWLFDRGRLLGATPVPGIGWIFVQRIPVRGPRSRVAVRDATRAKQRVEKAIAVATKEVVEPETEAETEVPSGRQRSRAPAPKALNDPMTFISFIAEHPLGEALVGEVEGFTSHGATVRFGEVLGYVPLSGLGDPAPRSARGVLRKGEQREVVVTALDPFRRGVELALPGVGTVSGRPSDAMVEAEVRLARPPRKAAATKSNAPRRAAKSGVDELATSAPAPGAPAKRTARRRKADVAGEPAVNADPVSATTAKSAPRRSRAVTPAVVAKAAATKVATKPVSPRRSPTKIAASTKATPAKKDVAKKAAPVKRISRKPKSGT